MKKFKRVFDILKEYRDPATKHKTTVAGRERGQWRKYTREEFIKTIDELSQGLLSLGLGKGDRVALMSGNRPEWNFIDFACNQIGVVLVPLYPTLSNHDLEYILKDAEVKALFISSQELCDKVASCLKNTDLELPLYSIDQLEGYAHYSEVREAGKASQHDLEQYRSQVSEEDLLTLIYTSGTTGNPKGVLLSHKNLVSNVSACRHLVTDEYKKALSFLPLCHIFERMVIYLYLSKQIEISYAETLDQIVVDIQDVKPDLFTTVPRVLEKVYDGIITKGKELKGIKKGIFFWAIELGHQFKEPPLNSSFYMFKLGIARKLVFSKWKEALGGNIKLIISGGAALQERLARIFWAADIKVLEGYGLTETSPVIAVNSWAAEDVKFGSVGRVLSNLDVKIAHDGEILVKGPSISSGYYNNPEETKAVIDQSGYLHTGDIGEITSDGFLKITDRKKEIFKTAGGKYVAPQVIENKLMESLLIAQVMVVGENKRFPSALIVPALPELEKWANHKQIPFKNPLELLNLPEVIDKYNREIDRLNDGFGQWEKVKKFKLLPKEWTIDAGELTPKLSLKRKIILQRFAKEIAEIYGE